MTDTSKKLREYNIAMTYKDYAHLNDIAKVIIAAFDENLTHAELVQRICGDMSTAEYDALQNLVHKTKQFQY